MADLMPEHHIQREIIIRLSKCNSLRFSELKPKNLENNVFTYHLNFLIKSGFVEKRSSLYKLALKGLTYADQLSFTNRWPRKQPKLIAILVIEDGNGNHLLAKRKVQPYYGLSMLPSGKQHFGEGPAEHAKRELLEKTGIKTKLRLVGFADIIISQNKNLISHVAAHIFHGTVKPNFRPVESGDRFEFYWQNEKKFGTDNLMPGTAELVRLIKMNSGNMFFECLEYDIG